MAVDIEYFGVPPADYREVESRFRYVAQPGQTTFSGAYTVNFVDAFLNGAKLDPVTEFTATNGVNVVLTSACVGGETFEMISRRQLSPTDIYSRSQVDALVSNYYGTTTGTGDALLLATTPSFSTLTDGLQVKVRTHATNSTTTPTININNIGPIQILTYNQQACTGGDWAANSEITLRYNQTLGKWLLLEGMLTAVSPSQFDNTAKFATTSFVQRASGNFQTLVTIASGTTYALTALQSGSLVNFSGSSNCTATLPLVSTVIGGSCYYIQNTSASASLIVSRAGSDSIYINSTALTSVTLQPGDTIFVASSTSATWFAFGGSQALSGSTGMFATTKSTSGYQKMPSGIILQWGSVIASSSADVVWTYPIVFPNVVLQAFATSGDTGGTFATLNDGTTSNINVGKWSASGTRASGFVSCLTVGY